MLEHLRSHLKGKTVILGIGNTLKSDDGAGSILASRLKDNTSFVVYDAGASPENYLGKIIREKPETVLIIDAADFGAKPGELNLIEGEHLETTNFYSTHNASISLTINYLKSNLKSEIIVLAIQPKTLVFGDGLSPEISTAIDKIEACLSSSAVD